MEILDIQPVAIAHDLHPDYISTGFAGSISDVPKLAVQHHHAHMASCMAENLLEGDVIGVIFDGAGFGMDGHVWGSEFLHGDYRTFRRRGHFRYVTMPGGDAAAREPLRMAIAYLYDYYGAELFEHSVACLNGIPGMERNLFLRMLAKGINTPLTSSCGRLFDAVAALLGLRNRNSYEGQAAIELEALAETGGASWTYPYAICSESDEFVADFRLMIGALIHDLAAGEPREAMSRRFHDTLAAVTVDMCGKIRRESGTQRVVLSGGVFQNLLLLDAAVSRLQARGFRVLLHSRLPCNDGGISLGQAVVAAARDRLLPLCTTLYIIYALADIREVR
jgi:hydrogenase maturation protein HypF